MNNFQYTCQYFISIFFWSSLLAVNIYKHKQSISKVGHYKSEIQYSHDKLPPQYFDGILFYWFKKKKIFSLSAAVCDNV